MKRHAKAPSADSAALRIGSTAAATRRSRGLFGLCCLCVLGLAAFLGTGAPAVGAAESFPGQGFLPDNRAWEMVSPVDKNSGDIGTKMTATRAAAGGGAVQFISFSGFADVLGSGLAFEYMARRTGSPGTQGWSTHSILPAQQPLALEDIIDELTPRYIGAFSDDLSKGIFFSHMPLDASFPNSAQVPNLYLRDDLTTPGAGSYDLVTDCPACVAPLPQHSFGARRVNLAATSSDFSHVLFESPYNLTQDAIDAGLDETLPKLYAWSAGTVNLVGVLPDGTPAPSSASGRGVGIEQGLYRYADKAVTADGSRAFFTSPVVPGANGVLNDCPAACSLYVRDAHGGPGVADDDTTELTADENALGTPTPGGAYFWTATPGTDDEGDRVPVKAFFTSEESLTDEPVDETDLDVFRWDESALPGSRLTRLSVDSEPDDGQAGIGNSTESGVIGVSDDGDSVYFIARNQLVGDGAPGVSKPCTGSAPCIFLSHDDGVGAPTLRYVASIDGSEALGILGGDNLRLQGPGEKRARVSPDGRFLAFLSTGTPSEDPPYDHGSSCGGTQAQPCQEVYLYDAAANGGQGEVACVSCNPTAVHTGDGLHSYNHPGDSTFNFNAGTAGAPSGLQQLNRPLSGDGSRLFFSTPEALVPEDVNGNVYDVYSYETGSGELHLLTPGSGPSNAFFLDASADGKEVFFTTRERLTGWDTDNQVDLYTARIDGGFPEPASPSPACAGDECQGASTRSPSPNAAGSSSYRSSGNLKSRRPSAKCSRFAARAKRKLARARGVGPRKAVRLRRQGRRLKRRAVKCRRTRANLAGRPRAWRAQVTAPAGARTETNTQKEPSV